MLTYMPLFTLHTEYLTIGALSKRKTAPKTTRTWRKQNCYGERKHSLYHHTILQNIHTTNQHRMHISTLQ